MYNDKLDEAKKFYEEKIVGWMLGDLKKCIECRANLLSALGCLVYTEIFGFMLPPLRYRERNTKSNRFYRALFRLKSKDFLVKFDNDVKKETKKRLYDHIRHSMVHSYLPTIYRFRDGKREFISSTIVKDGYQINGITNKRELAPPLFLGTDDTLVIATSNYLKELKHLINESFVKTFEERDGEYQLAAIKGIDFIRRRIMS